jgi:NADP-dependent 3-hydroxy acid dehydrogenase YdfG
MRSQTKNKPEVVVVTGVSAGVGRAIVQAFAKREAHIGLLARGHDGLEGARRDVEEAGGQALVIPETYAAIRQLIRKTKAASSESGEKSTFFNQ